MKTALANGPDEPDRIDRYLDELADRLRLPGHALARALSEIEDHLRESASDLRVSGMDDDVAQQTAVLRFGPAKVVARQFAVQQPYGRLSLLFGAGWALAPVFAIGLLAIGTSGALAAAFGAVFGKAFVSGDPVGVGLDYSASRCAQFLALKPGAASCSAAAVAHHFDEVVTYRLAAGVLGLLVLAVWLVARRAGWRLPARVLPDGFADTVGAALFGFASVGLLFISAVMIGFGGAQNGAGQFLSGGLVAVAVATVFGIRLLRVMQARVAS